MTTLGDLSPEELRAHLHRVADWIADYRAGLELRRITSNVEPGTVRAAFPSSLPAHGVPLAELLDEFRRLVVPNVVHWGHPRFLGYFGSTTTAPGIVAETLTAALNVSAMMWRVSPAAVELEQVVVDWLRQMLGLPTTFDGMLHDTASSATLHALAAAREVAGVAVRRDGLAGGAPMVVYKSDQAHSSIDKAAIVLGIGEAGLRIISSDDAFRMRADCLRQAIVDDRRAGLTPCAVVATIGTTSTGAVDPIPEIASICAAEHVWLHVDAAYGGALGILPETRPLLNGMESADSVVVNSHKWLFVPLDFSTLYTRRPDSIRAVFSLTPPYLRGDADEDRLNPMDSSLQLGRRFRALKAWMVWRSFGAAGIAARIAEHLRLARAFAAWVDADPDFECAAPVTMGIVCFRIRARPGDDADRLAELVTESVNRRGTTYLTHTRLRGRTALRIALGNVLTTQRHLEEAWTAIRAALVEVRKAQRPRETEKTADSETIPKLTASPQRLT